MTEESILLILDNISQKRDSEEVVGNVPRIEQQSPVRASFLSCCQGDLTIFHHLVDSVHSANHSHGLRRVRFLHHLPQERQQQEKKYDQMRYWRFAIFKSHTYSLAYIVFKALSQKESLTAVHHLPIFIFFDRLLSNWK